MKQLAAILVAMALVGGMTSAAHADDTAAAKEHYKLGLDAYRAGHYDDAIKELKKAYALKKLPALLLNIGATYRKMGDADNALSYYKKYLAEVPEAKDRAEVEGIVAEIEKGKGGGGGEPTPPAAEPAKTEWAHTPVDAAPPGQPLDVRVTMPVTKGVKVYVYYRGAGEADFTSVLMRRHGNEKVGRIPADAVAGKSLQYYIEGRDDHGSVVKSFGSPSDPNVVMLDSSAAPQVVADKGPTPAGAASDDEVRKDLDDEAAPITGTVSEPAGAHHHRHAASGGGSAKPGGLFWAGLAVAVVGVAGVAVGSYSFYQAKSYSDIVSRDSQGANGMPFNFTDPKATPYDDRTAEVRGKNWNTFGYGMMIPGGVFLAGGAVMMIVDRTALAHRGATEKPHRSTAWYLAPTYEPKNGQTVAGIQYGARF